MTQSTSPKKVFKPNNWNCLLEVGPNFAIEISGYVKISEYRAGKMVRFENHGRESYQVRTEDPELKEVPKEEIIQAFKFGTNIIPFDADLQNEVKYQSGDKCFQVLEFRKMHTVPSHLWAGRGGALVVFPQETHLPDSFTALCSLTRAMKSLNVGAIVRRVWNSRSKVKIGWLIPHPDEEGVMLYFQLPFAQQLRAITRKRKKAPRKATEIQKKAMGRFIEALTNRKDFDPYQVPDPSEVYLEECCEAKAEDLEAPIPPPSENVLAIFNQSPLCDEKAHEELVKEFFELWPKLKLLPKIEEKKKYYKKGEIEKKPMNSEETKNEEEDTKSGGEIKMEVEGTISQTEQLLLGLEELQDRLQNQYGFVPMERFIFKLCDIRKEAAQNEYLCKAYNKWWTTDFHEFVDEIGLDLFWDAAVSCGYGPISTAECPESDISPSEVSKYTRLEESPLITQTTDSQIQSTDPEVKKLLDEIE